MGAAVVYLQMPDRPPRTLPRAAALNRLPNVFLCRDNQHGRADDASAQRLGLLGKLLLLGPRGPECRGSQGIPPLHRAAGVTHGTRAASAFPWPGVTCPLSRQGGLLVSVY